MMKRTLIYIGMVVGILFMLTSCTSDILDAFADSGEATDGEPVTLTFRAALPGGAVKTRSTGSITNLTLLVFNEKHRYLYRTQATLANVVPKPAGITFEPELARENIADNNVLEFTVRLMTSSKPRIIHFVADYEKNKLDDILGEDHSLEFADEGWVMPRIVSQDKNDYSYWQSFYFTKIDEHSFDGKGFKLLRDKAKITVEDKAANHEFELKGFCIHNAPDRGTIVSYASKTELNNGPRPFYRDVLYTFPVDPTEPTMPADIKLIDKLGDPTTNKAPIPVFEYSNSQADADKQMSVILYGKGKADAKDSYYKLDIVRDIYTDPKNKTGYIGAQRFDIVRNYNYVIKIVSSKGKGYDTYEEAVRNPASNNLFGSVELQEFSDVTDGQYTLIVDNTNAIMTLPGHFYSPIRFIGPNLDNDNGPNHVAVYLNQKECNGHIDNDPYIDHAEFNKNTGVLDVNVKSIPTDADKHYIFNVVGTAPNGNTHIQRKIELILRKRYDFHINLIDKDPNKKQGSEVDVELTIPGTLPSTLYPFDVYIAADQLSPLVNAQHNDHMKVLKIGKRTYYVYTVTTPSAIDKVHTLHFQRIRTNGTCDVTAISDNFYNADAILPNNNSTQTDNRGLLTYTGISYTKPKVVPSEYRTQLEVSGVTGVEAKMASAGYVEFSGWNWANATGDLTLTATMQLGNGIVKAVKTLTVAEWKQQLKDRKTINLDITEVEVEEKAQYKESNDANYKAVPNSTTFTVKTSDTTGKVNVNIQSTGLGTYKMHVTGLKDFKTPISFTCEATIGGKNYATNSIYLSKIFDNPVMRLTSHDN